MTDEEAPQEAMIGEVESPLQTRKLEELGRLRGHLLSKAAVAKLKGPMAYAELVGTGGVTDWEELMCVGFHSERAELQAVVSIKRATGYSGDLCSDGSPEYVRFFIDWRDGNGFVDVGLTSFRAHDIPSSLPGNPGPTHPIQHMVSLRIDDDVFQKCCDAEILPRVRAVLSWRDVPSLDPNAIPHFGNRLDVDIQLAPSWGLACLLGGQHLSVSAKMLDLVDVQVTPKKQLALQSVTAVAKKYAALKVPAKRFLYPAIAEMLHPAKAALVPIKQLEISDLATLGIELATVFEELEEEEANTSYEELTCAGLNTAEDTLGAVIHIKRPSGYGGDLCEPGSTEYVTFWADFGNTGSFGPTPLGTAMVKTHDIRSIPAGGLYYAVFLPVNFSKHLRGCKEPNVIRIRAVLSWQSMPSQTDPDKLNTWGNRIDRLVRLRAKGVASDQLLDLLYSVSNVAVDAFDPVTHLAHPSVGVLVPTNCSQPCRDRPLAGSIGVRGRIYNTGAPGSVRYQIQIKGPGTVGWEPACTSVTFKLMHPLPSDPDYPYVWVTSSSADGWLEYMEDPTASPPILEQGSRLGTWNSNGSPNGTYQLRLAYTKDYPITGSSVIHYSDVVTFVVDNTNFVTTPTFGATLDPAATLDLVIAGGDCKQYTKNDTVTGFLRARDVHFWKWTMTIEPSSHAHGLGTSPSCMSYGSSSDQGPWSQAWSLAITQGGVSLDPCGYTITLRGYDRAIVNGNSAVVHHNHKAVGFSVLPP